MTAMTSKQLRLQAEAVRRDQLGNLKVMQALRDGGPETKSSALVMGLGNMVHKQVIKGLLFLAVEIAYIAFMVLSGFHNLHMLGSLGTVQQQEVWNEELQVYLYTKGDQSILLLLYGVATILLSLAVFWMWRGMVKSAYKAELCDKRGWHVNTFGDDLRGLLNENPKMFMNTLIVAIFSCLLSTFLLLSVSYCLSRMRFKMRKPYMNMAMILGLFPGFMFMIAVYFILKAVGLTEGNLIRIALIMCCSGGAALGFQVTKGFFDTTPYAIDEAAMMDGCTRWQIFTKITLPLSKPIVVYSLLTSFINPCVEFIFAKVICRANADQYTIAIGLWRMLEKEYIDNWYTSFAAGAARDGDL